MKGVLIEKGEGWYIVLTPTGQYKKIRGTSAQGIGAEVELPAAKAGSGYIRVAALAAAVLLLVAMAAGQHLLLDSRVYAYITIEANHDVEFAVDRQNRVLSARGYEPGAVELLSRIDYLGADVQKVISEFTLASLGDTDIGTDEEKEVVVSYYPLYRSPAGDVDSKLEQLAREQQKAIGERGKQVQFATVVLDKETREEAKSKGIAPGRLKKAEASGKTKDNSSGGGEAGDTKGSGKEQKENNSGKGFDKGKGEDARETEARDRKKGKEVKEKDKQEKKQAGEEAKQDREDETSSRKQDKETEKSKKHQEKIRDCGASGLQGGS